MKIFIPFQTRDIGGPSTFVKKFKKGMEICGHQVVFEESGNYDILFLIVQAPFDILMRAKRKNKVIVQRLDGAYYWSVAAWRYPLYNFKALLIRHFFADYTIYQSIYSKYCSEKFLLKKNPDPSTIIYNGVDTNIFSPIGETINLRDTPRQKIFFTASDFRRKDQLRPILGALKTYKEKNIESFKFVIAGSFSRELKDFQLQLGDYPWVTFLGKIPNSDLPRYERSSDVFLFTHLNPPCPNNVIEAMSCGLPICGVADGAMPELVRHGSEGLLSPVEGDAFWKERTYDKTLFADNLSTILNNKLAFKEAARTWAYEKFSITTMIEKYIDVFEKLKIS